MFCSCLLNALDMQQRGMTVKIIIEGMAVTLPAEINRPDLAFHGLYAETKAGLIEGVCKACSAKMGSLVEIQAQKRLADRKPRKNAICKRRRQIFLVIHQSRFT